MGCESLAGAVVNMSKKQSIYINLSEAHVFHSLQLTYN